MTDFGMFRTHRRGRRWFTHPLAPAVGVALLAAALVGMLAAEGEAPAVAVAWIVLPLAAGYAISGSP